eukprot:1152881-Pelagomonas_calceolata.AAC.8
MSVCPQLKGNATLLDTLARKELSQLLTLDKVHAKLGLFYVRMVGSDGGVALDAPASRHSHIVEALRLPVERCTLRCDTVACLECPCKQAGTATSKPACDPTTSRRSYSVEAFKEH